MTAASYSLARTRSGNHPSSSILSNAVAEDPSVKTVAERVKALAREELGREVDIKLVDNPRSAETLVEAFAVDTTKAREQLGWEPEHTVDASVRELLRTRADTAQRQERVDRSPR